MLFASRLSTLLGLLRRHGISAAKSVQAAGLLALCLALQPFIRREDRLYAETVRHQPIADDPLFITGHWRSGTTYLHQLVALDAARFAAPTTYQCLFPTLFLTLGTRSALYRAIHRVTGTRSRRVDAMTIALDTPQEEELMYLPEGSYSYIFERLIFPRTAMADRTAILRRLLDEETRGTTLRIFRKLTAAHGRRIVSKSPGHFGRLPLLADLFPASRFAVLVRSPFEVVPSMVHAQQMLSRVFALQRHPPMDVRGAADLWTFYSDVLGRYLDALPPDRYAVMRFEDLMADPVRAVRDLYERFDFEYTPAYHAALTERVRADRAYRRNPLQLTDDARHVIASTCARALDAGGYAR